MFFCTLQPQTVDQWKSVKLAAGMCIVILHDMNKTGTIKATTATNENFLRLPLSSKHLHINKVDHWEDFNLQKMRENRFLLPKNLHITILNRFDHEYKLYPWKFVFIYKRGLQVVDKRVNRFIFLSLIIIHTFNELSYILTVSALLLGGWVGFRARLALREHRGLCVCECVWTRSLGC